MADKYWMPPEEPMQMIYVCSPYRPVAKNPEEAKAELARNVERATKACQLLSIIGAVPIAPHIYFTTFLNDAFPKDRKRGMEMGAELLCKCDELWVFGDRISEGMEREIHQAKASDITVRYAPEPEDFIRQLISEFEPERLRCEEKKKPDVPSATDPDYCIPDEVDEASGVAAAEPEKAEPAKPARSAKAKKPEEPVKAAETEKTAEPAESEAKAKPAAPTISLNDLTQVITAKLKQDRENNKKIPELLKVYGCKKVSELPQEKYEAFITDLQQL